MNEACATCQGACCETFGLNMKDLLVNDDVKRWLTFHGEVRGDWIYFNQPCRNLQDGRCQNYNTRPNVCVNSPVGGLGCIEAIKRRRKTLADEIIKLTGKVKNVDGKNITAFHISVLSGIASVLLDVDHIPCYLNLMEECRPTHGIIQLIAGIVGACMGGLYFGVVLKCRKDGCAHSADQC